MKIVWLILFLFTSGAIAQTAPPATGAAPPAAAGTPSTEKSGVDKKTDAAAPKIYDPQKQCVDDGEFNAELKSGRNSVGETIVIDTNFLPTNQAVNAGVRTPYVDKLRFFAALERDDGVQDILHRQDVVTRRAVASDPLVKKKLLEADQTIVTFTIDDEDAGSWQKSTLYLYTCGTSGSPARVSKIAVRLSPYWYSLWICLACVVFAYVGVAFLLRKQDHTFQSFLRSLDPVKLSAGPDGKGSLSKFQVLSFSLTVFALILLFTLQTGMLSDLSTTILTLLGISGIGATLAKGADAQRTTIAPENRAWLLRKGWLLAARTEIDTSNASWRDFFTTDGEFDVYRYQSFIFGGLVVLSLIAAGVTQLSTFAIPDTILGIVGLSQAVYIGGKLVTPTSVSDLNTAITNLRDQEKKFRDAATAKKQAKLVDLAEATTLLGQPTLDAYRDKALDAAALFESVTGNKVPTAALDPTVI